MTYRIDYHNIEKHKPAEHGLPEHWKLDEWPNELIVYHQLTPNVVRRYVDPVRCGECTEIDGSDSRFCSVVENVVEPDDYCSWGERRVDA